MDQTVDEQLSALLDGETAPEEIELLLARLERDSASRAALARYAMIGEALRGGIGAPLDRFQERIRTAIQNDGTAAVHTPRSGADRAAFWRVGLGAVVATAAAAAVVAIGLPGLLQLRLNPAPEVAVSQSLASSSVQRAMTPRYLVSHPSPIPAERLTAYLVAHGAYANEISQSSWDARVINGQFEHVDWQTEEAPDAP